jgi:hypothetical protein
MGISLNFLFRLVLKHEPSDLHIPSSYGLQTLFAEDHTQALALQGKLHILLGAKIQA